MKRPLSKIGVFLRYFPKLFLKSGTYRIKLKKYLGYKKYKKLKLAMTLLVKDEENLIEQNIRFHRAMGVDVFIVTLHNSTDNTLDIINKLKAEGLPIVTVIANEKGYLQAKRVDKMIKTAKKVYKADWVINADADEFYYSKDLNLKKSIAKYDIANVIRLESTFSFPAGNGNRLLSPYFITNSIPDFWYKLYPNLPKDGRYTGVNSCPKVIHKTKSYIRIHVGNHDVSMRFKKILPASDIILFHFSDGNYNDYEAKVKRYMNTFIQADGVAGGHVKFMIDLYNKGKLKEFYDKQFSSEILEKLLDIGCVTKNYLLINYLKYKDILR